MDHYKIIIFCEHAVETLTYFSRQLAHAFAAWGYEVFWLDFDLLGLSAWKMHQAVLNKEAVLITFNFIGLSGEEELWELDEDGIPVISIWEKLGIRCFNIMVDHPIYYYQALCHAVPDMHAFCVDRDHTAYMKRFYPGIKCEFLPLAGNLVMEDFDRENDFAHFMARPYGLVFTANYVPVANIERQLMQLEPEYRKFYYEIIESFLANPGQDLLSCIEFYMRREIPDLDDAGLCEGMSTMPAVDLWVRTYFREKTVRILAEGGIPVYIIGKDWEQITCKNPENVISCGHMANSIECVHAMAQGKLALNTMPWFKDGAHDRVFTAMLQGAAVFTDGSTYLKEQFADGESLFYYDLDKLETLPQQAEELLNNPQRLYDAACCGTVLARRFHTWECRAEVLRRYIEEV